MSSDKTTEVVTTSFFRVASQDPACLPPSDRGARTQECTRPECQGLTTESPSMIQACPPLLETTNHGVLWDTEEKGAATHTAGTAARWGAEGRTIPSRAKTRASAISRQPENQSPGQVRDTPNTHRGSQERRQGPSVPHTSTCEHLENCCPQTRSGERQHVRRPSHC